MRVFKANNSKLNMCDYCLLNIPACPKATVLEFGDGIGDDNVIACSEYVGSSLPNNIPIELDISRGIVKSGDSDNKSLNSDLTAGRP